MIKVLKYIRIPKNMYSTWFNSKITVYETVYSVCNEFWCTICEFFDIMSAQMFCNLILIDSYDTDNEDIKPEMVYAEKYWDEFNNAPTDVPLNSTLHELFLNKLSESILTECTPMGEVIMYFDNDKCSFVYFCDKNIPIACLETVARKYVITFSCKSIYTLKNVLHRLDDLNVELEVKNADVFAKFKKYNLPKATSNNIEIKKNRFTNHGKLCNFNVVKIKPTMDHVVMSFSEFKKQNK
jgi:hypothetical protein